MHSVKQNKKIISSLAERKKNQLTLAAWLWGHSGWFVMFGVVGFTNPLQLVFLQIVRAPFFNLYFCGCLCPQRIKSVWSQYGSSFRCLYPVSSTLNDWEFVYSPQTGYQSIVGYSLALASTHLHSWMERSNYDQVHCSRMQKPSVTIDQTKTQIK